MLAGIQRAWIVAVLPERFRKSLITSQHLEVTAAAGVGRFFGASVCGRLVGGLVLALCSSLAAAEAVEPELSAGRGGDVSSLSLRDQFGEPGGLTTEVAGLQLAIVVSAKRLRRLKAWEQAIRKIDEDVSIIRVADVPRTAPTEYETVAAKLKKRLPPDLAVLIDLKGVWAMAFELDVNVPTVLIFDGAGVLLARHAGMYKKSYFAALEMDLTGLSAPAASSSADIAGTATGAAADAGSVDQSP